MRTKMNHSPWLLKRIGKHIKQCFPVCITHMQSLFPNGRYHFPPTSETLRLRTPTPSWHCSSSITVLSGRWSMDELDWQIKPLLFSPGPFLGVTVADVYLTPIRLAQASEKISWPELLSSQRSSDSGSWEPLLNWRKGSAFSDFSGLASSSLLFLSPNTHMAPRCAPPSPQKLIIEAISTRFQAPIFQVKATSFFWQVLSSSSTRNSKHWPKTQG